MKNTNKNLISFRISDKQKEILEEYVIKNGVTIPGVLREFINSLEGAEKEYNPIEEIEQAIKHLKLNGYANTSKEDKNDSMDKIKGYALNYKECSECKEVKNISEFYKDSKMYLGVKGKCKTCDDKARGLREKKLKNKNNLSLLQEN